jgi:hypothetical protein
MSSTVIAPYTSATIVVPTSSAIAVWSPNTYQVYTSAAFANYPTPIPTLAFNATGAYTSSVYTASTTVTVQAGGSPLYYNVGTAPVVFERANFQGTPGTLNATGTLTGALIMGGIVTSSTAAAVTATLDTGAVLEPQATFAVGDSFDWVVVNTGGSNAFTVTASTGHTVTGSGAVAASTSGRFRTYKTATNTFVTVRS